MMTSSESKKGSRMGVNYTVHGEIAVIKLNNPPVNGLGFMSRLGITQGLERANADPSIRAIVITGQGRAFSGGADIREFGTPKSTQEPTLLAMIYAVEVSEKPVVCAMHSVAMGGGLELALGCHYRIAAPGCMIALPEIKLGLIPGAGGTQRLPRALGVEAALNMITKGEPIKSDDLFGGAEQRLFDRMSASRDTLLHEALAFAQEISAIRPLPMLRHLPCSHPNGDGYFQFARDSVAARAKNYPALFKCIEAVESATRLDFEAGLVFERDIFNTIMLSPESRALRHVFFAERATSKIADVPEDTAPRPIQRVGVIGAGTMGGGIAMCFLNAGLPVNLLDTTQSALDKGLSVLRKNYELQVRKGKLAQEDYEQRLAMLTTTLEYGDLSAADLVIEAVYESMEVKEAVFKQLDAVMKPGAILASNTSTLNLNQIAKFTARPQDVVGLHFFSPAHVMRLLEVVRGDQTGKEVLATAMDLAKKIKKMAVVSGVCDGFIGNRMAEPYIRQALFLLDEGCTPEQVDHAIESFGFAMGPFRMCDLSGNDIWWAIRKRRYVEMPHLKYSKIADALCDLGRFGQKTGAGWYDYPAGRRDASSSLLVQDLIEQHRKTLNITPRLIDDKEIVQRLVFALVNEGAHILDEGIAGKASDIDMVYITGYGFPDFRGGPMQYADTVGLFHVIQAMRGFARNPLDDANFWQPAPLLTRLVTVGQNFNGTP
jgi:3-hydroxyacyl-CoA dehydrogenase